MGRIPIYTKKRREKFKSTFRLSSAIDRLNKVLADAARGEKGSKGGGRQVRNPVNLPV